MHGGCHILVASDIEFLAVNILQTRSTSKQGLAQRPWMSDQFFLITLVSRSSLPGGCHILVASN